KGPAIMAYETFDLYIQPEDGWVEVAENPTALIIRPEGFQPWWLAVTAGGEPNTATVAAAATLTFTGQPTDGQIVTVAGVVYTVVETFDGPGPRDFLLGDDAEGTIDNLVEIINGRDELPATQATGTVTI